MTAADLKKEVVDYFMNKKILLSDDFINNLPAEFNVDDFYNFIASKINDATFLFFDQGMVHLFNDQTVDHIDQPELERFRALYETQRMAEAHPLAVGLTSAVAPAGPVKSAAESTELKPLPRLQLDPSGNVKVVFSYQDEPKKWDVQDFVAYYNTRYRAIKSVLENRQELQSITSINRLLGRKERAQAAIIGMVQDKGTTQNENIVLTLEDPTGIIKVIVNKSKPELFSAAKETVLDEVIGVVGVTGENILFANTILQPDIPLYKELKKSPDECYAIFISDIHVGSKLFLPDEFGKLLKWLRGEMGSDAQRDVAKKVRYIFVIGDLVDGVGVYPGQESELAIPDIKDQYAEFARLISQIPQDKRILICPGNHDTQRLAEPQPVFDKEYAGPLCELPNVTLVTNPAYVNIHASPDFPGFDVLMYHGYSFDYFIATVDSIRQQGGYDRADLVMKFLLQRRHMSPTHTATLYIPDPKKDPLVIDKIPDFFATGHIHKAVASMYRNITLISGSCWQAKTGFQEKMGHNPEPARVPLVNLQTRQVKMLRF